MLLRIRMFYSNNQFKKELLTIKKDTKKNIIFLNSSPINKSKKIESDLRISLILQITGVMEIWFDDIILEFAIKNTSPIFHNYFHSHFTSAGKGVKPNNINGFLISLGASAIKSDNSAPYRVVEDLYALRDRVAHGSTSFQRTLEEINEDIDYVIKYMNLIIKKLDVISIKVNGN